MRPPHGGLPEQVFEMLVAKLDGKRLVVARGAVQAELDLKALQARPAPSTPCRTTRSMAQEERG